MREDASRETTPLYDRPVNETDRALLERALGVAAEADSRAYPKPTVGAVVVADGDVVGEAATEAGRTGRHAEPVALEAAGGRARGATLYVTMEPCAHSGSTPPCVDAVLEAGIARVVAGQLDPNPRVEGGGLERLRAAGVEVELAEGELGFRARQQLEEWRTWVTLGRPFVTYKVAVTLDGRVRVPDERWVTGETSRTLVHVLRAASDAVAVGMGTVRWDDPRLDARDVPTPRGQPRRLAFGRGPLPEGSELELRSGPLREELAALATDGVQSLLLEGGPTLAAAFLEQELVDKLLVFVAPKLSGEGPGMLAGLAGKLALTRLVARSVGEDVLLQAYLHEP
jgi:diaminohydroxyphosphoribosylaminopyrimidine deaminase / 5-amino-6-(5-phosphoribosylamino)uracil reductase